MKTITIIFSLLLTTSLFSQVKKEVDNGVWVTFPNTPIYQTEQEARQYITQTDNAIFMAIIADIPQRAEYLIAEKNFSEAEKKEVAESFLNDFIRGALVNFESEPEIQSIKKGKFYGKKYSFSAINPMNGEVTDRGNVILFVRGRAVSFQCVLINNSQKAHTEKNSFLNSISVNP
ncbi:MAG: hypothetical protein ACFNP4_07125 [Capnocytophaga gingivalis]|jgi:hypothetical protein|uniref:hypothetical protein n=1 Tax=Capnocytophaga gingivalis TaxID=1017 RepID=UPI0036186CBD